jgi:hypothetical protein
MSKIRIFSGSNQVDFKNKFEFLYSPFREVCPLKQIILYGKVIKIKEKCQKIKGEYQKCAFPQGKITPSIEPRNGE